MALGNKEVMARNIKKYMDQKGVNQTEMCKDLGLKFMTLSDWLHAKTYPRIDKIEIMARYFGISKADLVEESTLDSTSAVRIPVYGKVAAGIPLEMITDILDWEEIPASMAKGGEYFALRIHGNSMEPKISDGDVVIIHKQPDAESGDIVIATVNGDSATCKRLRKHHDGIELVSNNPSYAPKFFTNQEILDKPITILGKVVELRAKF